MPLRIAHDEIPTKYHSLRYACTPCTTHGSNETSIISSMSHLCSSKKGMTISVVLKFLNPSILSNGLIAMSFISGKCSLRYFPAPSRVPEVQRPATKKSIFPNFSNIYGQVR